MTILREPYQYLMGLFCRLNGLKYCTIFRYSWVPFAYAIANYRWTFNWGEILSNIITRVMEKIKENQTRFTPTFCISTYLLDCICDFMTFSGMFWDENSALLIYTFVSKPITEKIQTILFPYSWFLLGTPVQWFSW